MEDLLQDLHDEQAALRAVLDGAEDAVFELPTRSAGWRVRDQIGHLAHYDEQAALAATEPEAFTARTQALLQDLDAFTADAEAIGRTLTGGALLRRWEEAAERSRSALAAVPEGARIPWYGPSMSVRSFVTARLMETWAHGTDVVDALHDAGLPADRPATDRLVHLCHLGVLTRGWSYTVRAQEPPSDPVAVELVLPSGQRWTNGVEGAHSAVRGSAEDFCLVVTQRRNVADTGLEVVGGPAAEWMSIAQCFAGAPTLPPRARTR